MFSYTLKSISHFRHVPRTLINVREFVTALRWNHFKDVHHTIFIAIRNEFLFFIFPIWYNQIKFIQIMRVLRSRKYFFHAKIRIVLALISTINFTNTWRLWKFLFFVQLPRTTAHFVPYEISMRSSAVQIGYTTMSLPRIYPQIS